MNENRHRTLSLMNDIHPEYVVNVAFGGAKDGIDGKIGKDGEPGKDGAPGEDGFSPIVEAFRNQEDTGIIVRITDKDGTRETYVQDGTSSTSDRSEMFNQRLDDVLRFQNYVSGEFDYTTDTSIRATDIEMSTDGDKPGKISLEAAETINGQTRIQSGKIWLGDYNSSGDYEKLITLDAINNSWRTYQTIIQNGELSLKDLDNGYRTVVISGASSKPYIDMRSDSNSSTHSIKLQVNGDKGSTNILNGQIVLKDENGNKQIDISSRTNGKGIVKMSDVKIAQSETKNGMKLVRLYDTDGDGLFTIGQDGIQYASLDGPFGTYFFDTPSIDKTIPTLPEYPDVQVDDAAFTPTWSLDGRTPQGNDFWYTTLGRSTTIRDGHTYLTSIISTDICNSGYDLIYSWRKNVADDRDGSYNGYEEVEYYTSFQNGGYADLITAHVQKPYPGESYPDTGEVILRDALGNDTLIIRTSYDDNEYQYNEVELNINDGAGTVTVDGGTLAPDERMYLNGHRLSDMVTYTEIFTNGGVTDLKTNTIHYATQLISNKEFRYYADCIIEFSTVASGPVTIQFPIAFRFAETPVFGNNEHWIIGVKANYVVWTKYDLSQ